MVDSGDIKQAVEKAVSQAVEGLRAQVTDKVLEQVYPLLEASKNIAATASMLAAVRAMEASGSQADILNALLDGCEQLSGRCALFAMRGSAAAGWQSRGFPSNEVIRAVSVELSAGLAAQAVQGRKAVPGRCAQFDARLASGPGAPASGECVVVPLFVREKSVALLYADAGGKPLRVDAAGMEVLVRFAGNWIELAASRKTPTHSGVGTSSALATPAVTAPPQATVPVASHSTLAPGVEQERAVMRAAAAAGSAAGLITTVAEPTGEEDETQRKARRFAKLLVDELKLYNQAKLSAGKQNGDIYDRLREDIEKSRQAYEKRYAGVQVANHFKDELIRGLADGDVALLGPNFPR